jgi:hypothetical protein
MRLIRLSRAAGWVVPTGLVFVALGLPVAAHAEIYGWVDGNGTFTYSNLPPPDSARVTDVIQEDPPASPKARADAQRLADVAALNDRVRLLELQEARQQRELAAAAQAAGYGPPPPAPADYVSACGPDSSFDCAGYAAPGYIIAGGWPAYYARGGYYRNWHAGWRGGWNAGGRGTWTAGQSVAVSAPAANGRVSQVHAVGAAHGGGGHR